MLATQPVAVGGLPPLCGGKCVMGMREVTATMPDLLNLPVYRVTKTMEERVGNLIHVLHGYESFGQTVWTHVEIWDPCDMMRTASRCAQLSLQSANQHGERGH